MFVTGETTITLGFMLTIIGAVATLYGIYANSKQSKISEDKTVKDEYETEIQRRVETAENFTRINMKLDELCRGNADIRKNILNQSQILNKNSNDISKNAKDIALLSQTSEEMTKEIQKLREDVDKNSSDIIELRENIKTI